MAGILSKVMNNIKCYGSIVNMHISVILCCYLITCVSSAGDDDFEGHYTLLIEHSFHSSLEPVFTKRGTISIRSLKSGSAEFNYDGRLSDTDRNQLELLVQTDGVYRIRASRLGSDENHSSYVYTFIKACTLYESRLSDTLTVHVDQSGVLLAVSDSTAVQYCQGLNIAHSQLEYFNTTINVFQTVNGPAPETQAFIQKMEQEKIEKAKGQQADNRSLFAKYWIYIVPLVIFMMLMSNNMDPNAQGGGGR